MNQSSVKKGMAVKDLVTVGIFSALFLVFAFVGGIFFAPNPVLTFYMPVGSALLCGPVYLLMLAKVQAFCRNRSRRDTVHYLVCYGYALGNGTRLPYYGNCRRPCCGCGAV